MGKREFNYDALPYGEIAELYRQGWGWFGLAERYHCPDHKTLARHAVERVPDLALRDHAESQRARRRLEKAPAGHSQGR